MSTDRFYGSRHGSHKKQQSSSNIEIGEGAFGHNDNVGFEGEIADQTAMTYNMHRDRPPSANQHNASVNESTTMVQE